jgi:hypothetical protein
MSGVQLSTSEMAYLLALIDATSIVGLKDPALFPQTETERDTTYGQGWKDLEASGWLKTSKDYPDEYELNPILLEMVSIVANPDFVVATAHSKKKGQQLVLHYLVGEGIVELSAPEETKYLMGVLPDRDAFLDRVSKMLELDSSSMTAHASLRGNTFQDMQALAKQGKLDRAKEVLSSTGLEMEEVEALLAAISGKIGGQIVVVRPYAGEIEAGRKALIFGKGKTAWLAMKKKSDAPDMNVATCDPVSIAALVTDWMDNLAE